MTKEDLIFDWKKSESRGRDKFFALVVVASLFAAFAGLVELRLPTFRDSPSQGAGLIRFTDEGMARSWLLEAEENGPFPGRLEVADAGVAGMIMEGGGLEVWTDYSVSLRPLAEAETMARAEITPKGKRVFPAIPAAASDRLGDISSNGGMRRYPVLIPYDRGSLEWMPEEMPDFALPAGAEVAPDSLRFALELREDGSVAEVMALASGGDSAQEAVERWLRGVRFKEGTGGRWFGLRVDFVNRREDVAQPE